MILLLRGGPGDGFRENIDVDLRKIDFIYYQINSEEETVHVSSVIPPGSFYLYKPQRLFGYPVTHGVEDGEGEEQGIQFLFVRHHPEGE